MRVRPTSKSIWAVSYPMIVVGISETIVEVTDSIFLGHYGITELGAVALGDALYEMMLVTTIGLADGMQVVMGRRAGRGSARAVGTAFNQGLVLLLISSLFVFAAVRWGGPLLSAAVVGDDGVRVATDGFLRVIAFGALFDAINLAWAVFYLTISRTRVLLGATVVLAGTNVALDSCLIFGNLGAPRLGIEGAAAGSVAAEVAACCFLTLYALAKGDIRRFGLFRWRRWDGTMTRVLARISAPVALEALVETSRWFLFFAIIERLGETALASANVLYCCYVVLLVPVAAFAETACSMTSNLIGQGAPSRIRLLLRRTLSMSYAVTLPLMALALAFPDQVLWIFTDDPAALETSRRGLVLVAVALVLGIPSEVLLGAVTGTGDTKATLVIEVVVTGCVLLLCAVAAQVLRLPSEYLWIAVAAGAVARITMSIARLRRRAWREMEV